MNPAGTKDPETRTSDFDRAVGFLHERHAEPAVAADAHALGALDFARVLDVVAGYAATPLGAADVRALVPLGVPHDTAGATSTGADAARNAISTAHAQVAAMRALVGADQPWPSPPIADLWASLARLEVPGSAFTPAELQGALLLLVGSRAQASAWKSARERDVECAPLAPLVARLVSEPKLETALEKVVDDTGAIRDGASHDLKKIRRQLQGAEADLIKLLERVIAKLAAHHRVDDASVTMRNGRWVVPVRREGVKSLGGLVHDTSATGATVFVEPPAAVEFGNRIRELEAAEKREIERILHEVTDLLRPHAGNLAGALSALIELDSLLARARFADAFRCAPATFWEPAAGFSIVDGRHPLLVAKRPDSVVPFSLAMDPAERTLLVSGPNTGGKTVLLKAVALLSLMAQAGIPAPVAAGTVLPLFDRVFADIGDEQSIEASLSTFSGHVRNLIEIVEQATSSSLVLTDELGSGTDPNEGAALGSAILETLTRRGTTTIATTHLGALKQLAQEVPGVVNASLQFDEAALAPTYRLLKGIPGRSYGLSIARRLAMPAAILENAEARVPQAERDAAALISDLERRQDAIAEREQNADDREESYAERAEKVSAREQAARAKERELEREGRDVARKYLLDARKEIEAAIAAIKTAGADLEQGGGVGGGGGSGGAFGAAASGARRLAEGLLAGERDAARALDDHEMAEAVVGEGGDVRVGDFVSVASFGGATARVIEAREDGLVVLMGSVRATVAPNVVRVVKGRKRVESVAASTAAIALDKPDIHASPEVDLRGMRISEVDAVVQRALDSAVLADLPALRIIHGKGTGALRERVGELLREDRRVRSFRLGAWNEGGAGVTVAEIA